MDAASIEYWSSTKKFGAQIPSSVVEKILQFAKESGNVETGGILVGCYNRDHTCAMVEDATGPPADSQRSHTWFRRGLNGLQALLERLWDNGRRYYLGEWHYHPGGSATPSSIDSNQMIAIAQNKQYACPEPLLLILGGHPTAEWDMGIFVYPRNGDVIRLQES